MIKVGCHLLVTQECVSRTQDLEHPRIWGTKHRGGPREEKLEAEWGPSAGHRARQPPCLYPPPTEGEGGWGNWNWNSTHSGKQSSLKIGNTVNVSEWNWKPLVPSVPQPHTLPELQDSGIILPVRTGLTPGGEMPSFADTMESPNGRPRSLLITPQRGPPCVGSALVHRIVSYFSCFIFDTNGWPRVKHFREASSIKETKHRKQVIDK